MNEQIEHKDFEVTPAFVKRPNERGEKAAIYNDILKIRMPFFIWFIVISTMLACIGGEAFLGYRLSGFTWFIPLVFAILMLARNISKTKFPLYLWIPWICVVSFYFIFAEDQALQRSVQLLCPIVVGMAASGLRLEQKHLSHFLLLTQYLIFVLLTVVVLKTGMLVTGILPQASSLSSEVMTGLLLCTIFSVKYSLRQKQALFNWGLLALLPVIALTRTALAVTGLTIPLTLGPLKLGKRVLFMVIIAAIGIILFFTPRFQTKMFFSGSGDLSDVLSPDFRTSGRSVIWEYMIDGIREAPYWGHGANASEELVRSLTDKLTHPHNDWLRFLYDYGAVGTCCFGFTIVVQIWHLLKRAKRSDGAIKLLFLASASSFIPFVLMMFTDNIVLYASFFGNLQFTMIGMAYAADYQHSRRRHSPYETQRNFPQRPY